MSSEKLKPGFTTGAAAAAATKAALLYLTGSRPIERVEIRFLNNERISIAIHSVKRLSDNCAEATVIKDAGDDPDVTHNAIIGARVLLHNLNERRAETESKFDLTARRVDSEYTQTTAKSESRAAFIPSVIRPESITIRGGEGVGVVTKPGLEVQPGNPAINPGPQMMIREAAITALCSADILDSNLLNGITSSYHHDIISPANESQPHDIISPANESQPHDTISPANESQPLVDVEIFVPRGRELAQKTLNARLGILGGISILGTTGVVRPMSHDAYIATIRSGVSVAQAMGGDTVVFTTGRRSERYAISLFPDLPEERFIQTGDFFKASLEAAISTSEGGSNTEGESDRGGNTCIRNVIIVVFFGKAVKMAMGFAHTHAAKSELTMKRVAQWAEEIEGDSLYNSHALTGTTKHESVETQDLASLRGINQFVSLDFHINQESATINTGPRNGLFLKSQTQESANLNMDQNSLAGDKKSLSKKIAEANTARHAFTYIYPAFPKLICHIGSKIVESASRFSGNLLNIRAIILDFEGNPVFDSERCCEAATTVEHPPLSTTSAGNGWRQKQNTI